MRNGKRISEEVIAQIKDLKSQGMTRNEIAQAVNVSKTTVRRYLRPEVLALIRSRRIHSRVRTTINGITGFYRVQKRPRPENCEICGAYCPSGKKFLHWHHWDDYHLELGMWLCTWCHIFGNGVENGRYEKYLELKEKVYELAGPLGPDKEPELLSMRPIITKPA